MSKMLKLFAIVAIVPASILAILGCGINLESVGVKTDKYYYQIAIEARENKHYGLSNQHIGILISEYPQSPLIPKANTLSKKNNADLASIDQSINQRNEQKKFASIEVIGWSCSLLQDSKTVFCEGRIKNLLNKKIPNVDVILTLYSQSNSLISSMRIPIDAKPITTNHVYTFRMFPRYNPAIHKATIEFHSRGSKIPTFPSVNDKEVKKTWQGKEKDLDQKKTRDLFKSVPNRLE